MAAQDALVRLVLAARESREFRKQVMDLLNLPANQRESLVNSALHEMALRGEPADVRAAFAMLATADGAAAAAQAIERG